ncbi:hypothetical protein HNR05_002963 [Leifsonia psychrotolerans]|uniref:Uncharacterized protein n=1 Tax=Glaciibacter psychrotolerans TaxID=670054 RepID=A0A7Z0J726_9MICO|nr:hypothetical protein [Leifsonia psychrotolerans]
MIGASFDVGFFAAAAATVLAPVITDWNPVSQTVAPNPAALQEADDSHMDRHAWHQTGSKVGVHERAASQRRGDA